MKLPEDIEKHLQGGTLAAGGLGVLLLISSAVHPALSIALAGPLLGWAVEQYQRVRGDGVPSVRDAMATAAPFEVLAVAVWVAL